MGAWSVTFHYFERRPCSALAPFVDVIWGVRGALSYWREVVLPNGAVELMINFGPVQKVIAYGDIEVDDSFRASWIAGMQDQPLVIASPFGSNHMSVRFRPGGAHAFFDLPIDELTNQVLDLDLLIGSAALSLRDRLGELDTDDSRCDAVEAWLLERMRGVHTGFATVAEMLELLQTSRYDVTVTELCTRLGLSNRRLIEQFRCVVGLAPKTMSRIARFHAVVDATKGSERVNWAQLAYRFSFADQAHLTREFRHFAGVTPTEFLQQRGADHTHVALY